MKKIRLFCFPYAGGSALVYNKWKSDLNRCIQLHLVELAGRGKRISEPYYNSVDEAVEDVFNIIKYELRDALYAFYGHSLGAIIAYQLAQKLRKIKFPQPVHIFFSGRGAPHIRRDDKKPYHTLPQDEFREKVLELGGTPEEFFQHPELLEVLLPLLRADFRVSWSYKHPSDINPLDCDITILTGKEEDLTTAQIEGWKLHSKDKCTLHSFEGGHFFINDPKEKKRIVNIINNTLVELAQRRIRIPA